MSLNKRDSDVGGMLSVPRSRPREAPAPVFNFTINAPKGDKGDPGTPGTGGVDPGKPPKPPTDPKKPGTDPGIYTPGVTDPGVAGPGVIKPGTFAGTAIDQFTQGVGAYASQTKPGFGSVGDGPQKPGELGGLAKGKGVGTGKGNDKNESQIANLLNLGLPAADKGTNKGKDGGKGDNKGKDGKPDNKGGGNKPSGVSTVLSPGGGGGGGGKGKDDDKGKGGKGKGGKK